GRDPGHERRARDRDGLGGACSRARRARIRPHPGRRPRRTRLARCGPPCAADDGGRRGHVPEMSRFHEEIREQPDVAAGLIDKAGSVIDAIGARYRELRPGGFVIVARGSSDHAALYAKYLFGRRNRALVALAAPSLFTRYASPPSLDGQCVIGISQSGASPDVLAVLEEAARQGAMTVAITNEPHSRMASVAGLLLPLHAGPERSVPASKTYTASLLALALISQAIDPDAAFARALAQVPSSMAGALKAEADLDRLLPALAGPRAIVLGRGFNFSTAEEIALKLTETSYVL